MLPTTSPRPGGRPVKTTTKISLRRPPGYLLTQPRQFTLHLSTSHRISYQWNYSILYDSSVHTIYVHDSRGSRFVAVERLMLTPKLIREVERCLLLFAKGRAVLVPTGSFYFHGDIRTHMAICLLTRLVNMGSNGKATVAHVLNILGGPMEHMESWGPPGRNKRRPCKVTVSTSLGGVKYTPCLGSPENYHATD